MTRRKTFYIHIHGDRWRVRIMPNKVYEKEVDPDAAGVTEFHKHYMDFNLEYTTFGVTIHELFHAYSGYLCIESATDLEKDDIEEINAAMLQRYWKDIDRQATLIYTKVKELKNGTGERRGRDKVRRGQTTDGSASD